MPMSSEIEAQVLEGLMSGASLNSVCNSIGINESTVRTQVYQDSEFHAKYTRAREIGYLARADRLADLVDSATNEDVAVLRLKLDHEKWSLSKMLPKVYGEKLDVTSKDQQIGFTVADAVAIAQAKAKQRTEDSAK